MSDFIPLSVPNLNGNELKYVSETIHTEWVSSAGAYVNRFESEIAKYVKVEGAVSCQSGTAGIHLALLAMEVTKEDAVIVPALTFIASVNPVRYIGAEPIFMDCDDSLCIDPAKLSKFLKNECTRKEDGVYCNANGKKIRVIIIVHVLGNMADMESLVKICNEYNIKILEDAAEALGTYYTAGAYKGKFAGTIGDVGVFSFNGNKIITTGGGGMIVSNNLKVLNHVKHLSTQAKADELRFIHDEVGYNYRMTNMQAALGVAQLEQLESFVETKKKNYFRYRKEIGSFKGYSLLPFRANVRPNYWFYSLYCNESSLIGRDEIIKRFSAKNIQTRPIWWPINKLTMYQDSIQYEIVNTDIFWRRIVNIPCSSNLKNEEIDRVISVFRSMIKEQEYV
jgi:perosamine synthetase